MKTIFLVSFLTLPFFLLGQEAHTDKRTLRHATKPLLWPGFWNYQGSSVSVGSMVSDYFGANDDYNFGASTGERTSETYGVSSFGGAIILRNNFFSSYYLESSLSLNQTNSNRQYSIFEDRVVDSLENNSNLLFGSSVGLAWAPILLHRRVKWRWFTSIRAMPYFSSGNFRIGFGVGAGSQFSVGRWHLFLRVMPGFPTVGQALLEGAQFSTAFEFPLIN